MNTTIVLVIISKCTSLHLRSLRTKSVFVVRLFWIDHPINIFTNRDLAHWVRSVVLFCSVRKFSVGHKMELSNEEDFVVLSLLALGPSKPEKPSGTRRISSSDQRAAKLSRSLPSLFQDVSESRLRSYRRWDHVYQKDQKQISVIQLIPDSSDNSLEDLWQMRKNAANQTCSENFNDGQKFLSPCVNVKNMDLVRKDLYSPAILYTNGS